MKKLSLAIVVLFFVNVLAYGQGHWEDNDSLPATWTTGNVGIGTDSPSSDLDIGNGTFEWANGGGLLESSYNVISWNKQLFRIALDADNNQNDATFALSNNGFTDDKVIFHLDGGNSYINTGGNVGIGATSPGEKLEVNGNLKISGDLKILDNSKITSEGNLTVEGSAGSYYPATLKLNSGVNAYLYGGTGGGDPHNVILAHTGSEARGNVGIGTDDPQTRLAVNGTITAKEIKIKLTGWSDFVFEDNYKLMPLDKLERHIKKEKSLPGIPNNKEVIEEGVKLGEMQAKLLEKVEELTLYVIELKKENIELKQRISRLEK